MINFFPPALNCKLRLAKKENKKKTHNNLPMMGDLSCMERGKKWKGFTTRKQYLYQAGKNISGKKSDFSPWKAVAWADTVL